MNKEDVRFLYGQCDDQIVDRIITDAAKYDTLKTSHDKLVEKLEKIIRKAEINPCESTECRLYAGTKRCIKCLEKANRAITKDIKQALKEAEKL